MVRVVANDGNGPSTNQTVTVQVQNLNEDPVFAITPPFDVDEGNTVVGQVSATDPENDTLVFSIDVDKHQQKAEEIADQGSQKS